MGNQLLEVTNGNLWAPGPRIKISESSRDWPRLDWEWLGGSSRVVGQWWPAAGLGALSIAVHAWDLLKEVTIIFITSTIVSVQFSCSVMSNSVTTWIPAHQASLTITNTWSLIKPMSVESVMPSSHLILCRPLLLLPPLPPSIRVFSNESTLCISYPKYWSFSFSISPSNEHPGLISFSMDWLDLPAVQGTLKSLLHHHSSKASIFRCSAVFTVQLSHPYMTTGKTIAFLHGPLFGKVMSLFLICYLGCS